jgi:Domain of unknown function (DUF4214)
LLNRQPDQGGFNNWLNAINGGTSILLVTDGFLRSDEYCTIVANSFYNQLLDRQSDPGGLNAWKDFLVKGKSIQDAIVGFCDSLEYKSKHPIPNQFVESLYTINYFVVGRIFRDYNIGLILLIQALVLLTLSEISLDQGNMHYKE